MRDFFWGDAKNLAAAVEYGSWRRGTERLGFSPATACRRVDAFEA